MRLLHTAVQFLYLMDFHELFFRHNLKMKQCIAYSVYWRNISRLRAQEMNEVLKSQFQQNCKCSFLKCAIFTRKIFLRDSKKKIRLMKRFDRAPSIFSMLIYLYCIKQPKCITVQLYHKYNYMYFLLHLSIFIFTIIPLFLCIRITIRFL